MFAQAEEGRQITFNGEAQETNFGILWSQANRLREGAGGVLHVSHLVKHRCIAGPNGFRGRFVAQHQGIVLLVIGQQLIEFLAGNFVGGGQLVVAAKGSGGIG